MLKKIISLIICAASLLCIAACGDTVTSNTTPTLTLPRPPLGWSSCILYPPGYHDGIKYEDIEYLTFEEMCGEVDCIVVVDYIYDIEYNDYYSKYAFNVKESILGDLDGEIEVYVKFEEDKNYRVMINGKAHYFWEISFDVTQETDDLVLFLTLEEDLPGFSSPQYTWYRAPFINLANLEYSGMYNDYISNHMTGFDFNNATRESVLAYVKSLVVSKNEN